MDKNEYDLSIYKSWHTYSICKKPLIGHINLSNILVMT